MNKMKTKPVYTTFRDKDGNIINRIPWTEADDDWIRAARLKKKALEEDKDAEEKLRQMENNQMVEIDDDSEEHNKPVMKIEKSTSHSKITGDFAENLILYWLSKHGFECARIDHTGIDLIARKKGSSKPYGISVKSRSRTEGKESEYLTIGNDNFSKIDDACIAFGCEPYFAIVIDAADTIRAYILSKDVLLHHHPMRERAAGWKMDKKWLDIYAKDDRIIKFELKTQCIQWW